jgi:hypothetical protein
MQRLTQWCQGAKTLARFLNFASLRLGVPFHLTSEFYYLSNDHSKILLHS